MKCLRRYEIEDALENLSDETPFEMQVKLTALTMIRQRARGDLLGVFVVPADAPDLLLSCGMLLNFIVQNQRLIKAGYYLSIQSILDECRSYNCCKYTL